MKFLAAITTSLLVLVTGCVSKSKADAQARAAFMAGQKSAYQSMVASQTDVIVLGNVQKHDLPWTTGMTLVQAIADAEYTGRQDPTDITLKRNSVQTEIDPKQLLGGRDMTLQPGDVIILMGQ
jgi:hypothetical protein